jgi:hypothetical protein
MPRYTLAQLASALRAGPSPAPPVDVADDVAWHTRQEQWVAKFLPGLQLPPPCELPERRTIWKAATRKHSKMVKQIAANWSGRSHLQAGLAAWANGDEDIIVYRSPLDYLLWIIRAKDVDRLPSRRKMRKEDALLHPPPNLSDYDVNARGPGSVPAIWFRQWYGRDYDDSKHRSSYESARRLWRRMVPEEQRAAALLARPMPLQSLQPRITLANAQDYPPPNLQDFMKEELGPGSAPYRWYAQMMGEDWQPACSIAYDTARKRWRRLLPEVRERERDRERTRERIEGAKNPHSGTTALSGGCEPLPGRIWYPGR